MEKKTSSLKKLFASGDSRSLAIPNVELYNIAFEISKLARHCGNYGSDPRWVQMEKVLAAPAGVVDLLSQKNTKSHEEE